MPRTLRRQVLDASVLVRLLEVPELARRLEALPAPALRELLLEIGIEDAGELIALASFEQLRDVFDEDLWRVAAPGADAGFDAERFALWLEVLLEAGDVFVADRLAEFSEDFLVFSFSQLVHVIDPERVAAGVADPDEAALLDKLVDRQGCDELDGFLAIARSERAWDAVRASLLALAERQPELLRALLQRICAATESDADDAGGLYALLSEGERLREDAAAERDDRRAQRGYVAPADARAFLALAQSAPSAPELDPITRVYFRELAPVPADGASLGLGSASPAITQLERLAARAGEAPGADDASALAVAETLFRGELADLARSNPSAHQRIVEELAYLANVLVAGDGSPGRAWRPLEAALRVLELCDAGLAAAIARAPGTPGSAARALTEWGAVGLFRIAWAASRSAAQRGVSPR